MKTKDAIKRTDVKRNFLKKILLRIDYTGIIDIKDLLKEFGKRFENKFENMEEVYLNQYDIAINDIDQVSETLSIPIKEIIKNDLMRYTKNTFGVENDIIFDIGKYFTTLTIDCKNYNSLDEYKIFFGNYVEFLLKYSNYVRIKRFGLRKMGGEFYKNFKEIFKVFENEIFGIEPSENNYILSKRNLLDEYKSQNKNDPNVNWYRTIEKGTIKDGDNLEEVYKVILDIDAYIIEDTINDNNSGFSSQISLINDKLFEFYKKSVTVEYLNEGV